MKVLMIGEAANHATTLSAGLSADWGVIALPREAAFEPTHDHLIGPDDAVISLRFRRPAGAPPFRLLHVPGAGLDGIDFGTLSPATAVCNVFEHEGPIAEYVLAALLEWEIGAAAMARGFTAEAWPDLYRARVPHGEIAGRTLGLIGYGRIGRAIALRARAFGMRIVAVDRSGKAAGEVDSMLPPDALHRMLAEADYTVIACPLTPATRGLIDSAALAAMKPTGVLVNVSRAEIVEEAALYGALSAGQIGGAVLDVWYRYPLGADDMPTPASFPFHALPNAVCTPHSSAWTTELPRRRYARIAENLERLRRGEALTNLVCAPRAPVETE